MTSDGSDAVRAVDLFFGAGGLSWGLAQACEAIDRDVDLIAVNHWDVAIETRRCPTCGHKRSIGVEKLPNPDLLRDRASGLEELADEIENGAISQYMEVAHV